MVTKDDLKFLKKLLDIVIETYTKYTTTKVFKHQFDLHFLEEIRKVQFPIQRALQLKLNLMEKDQHF